MKTHVLHFLENSSYFDYVPVGSYALDHEDICPSDIDFLIAPKDSDILDWSKPLYSARIETDIVSYILDNTQWRQHLLSTREVKVELLVANTRLLRELLTSSLDNTLTQPEVLYVLKAGQIVFPKLRSPKHFNSYRILLNIIGVERALELQPLVDEHRADIAARLNARPLPKLLGVTKEEFFDDYVTKYMDHDRIHELVAHNNGIPHFTRMQPNSNYVYCSRETFFNSFTQMERVQTVLEEAYVIAIERHLIGPHLSGSKPRVTELDAFINSLDRITTTLCSGWFREFALMNYDEIFSNYNENYAQDFFDKLQPGDLYDSPKVPARP